MHATPAFLNLHDITHLVTVHPDWDLRVITVERIAYALMSLMVCVFWNCVPTLPQRGLLMMLS
jgi:hypothetical protein